MAEAYEELILNLKDEEFDKIINSDKDKLKYKGQDNYYNFASRLDDCRPPYARIGSIPTGERVRPSCKKSWGYFASINVPPYPAQLPLTYYRCHNSDSWQRYFTRIGFEFSWTRNTTTNSNLGVAIT